MKKLIYTLTLVATMWTAGCSDLMETSPSGEVDKDLILSNVETIEVAMEGIYSTLYNRIDFVTANAHQCFGHMAVMLYADLMGEDMIHTEQGAGWFWNDYNYNVRARYTSKIQRCYFTWKYYYEIISNANYILSAEHTATGNPERLKDLMAQAYAVRAYAYFMLIQSYQQTYKGHEKSPGVPIYTEPTTSSSQGAGRGTVEDVYKQINSDLDYALTLFGESNLPQSHISHIDVYVTWLLKARVALVQNLWTEAAEAATEAMKKPGCTLLSMSEATVTPGTFVDETKEWTTGKTPFNSVLSSSVMWGAEVLSEQSQVFASFYSHMDACTDVYYAAESPKCISNWLYAQIPDTDVRKTWWNGDIGITVDDWSYGANINYNQHKFQWANQKAHTGDYIFMRLEEAYLIKAEALCRDDKTGEARDVLVELGSRRDPNYAVRVASLDGSTQTFGSTGTVTTLLDEILLQRRIELWGEVGRIYDILRQGMGWTRYWEVGGQKSNHTNYLSKYSEYLNFPADYIECILMIPQTEIDNNPNIGPEDQNPYIQ